MRNTNLKTKVGYYKIAELGCEISFPKEVFIDNFLTSSQSFRCDKNKINNFACRITVVEDSFKEDISKFQLLSKIDGVLGESLFLYENSEKYLTAIVFGDESCAMLSSKDFSESKVHIHLDSLKAKEILTSFFMVAFSQMAVSYNTVLVHASAIVKDGFGYAFLGKSGTGKSTHSSLWLRSIEDTWLLNDDNPAIKVDSEGKVFIYGTPWSGKTPCYLNERAELKALVRLEQAPENSFTEIEGLSAIVSLLPSCSSLRWNDLMYSRLCDILEVLLSKVHVCLLRCLPNTEAAKICYNSIKNLN